MKYRLSCRTHESWFLAMSRSGSQFKSFMFNAPPAKHASCPQCAHPPAGIRNYPSLLKFTHLWTVEPPQFPPSAEYLTSLCRHPHRQQAPRCHCCAGARAEGARVPVDGGRCGAGSPRCTTGSCAKLASLAGSAPRPSGSAGADPLMGFCPRMRSTSALRRRQLRRRFNRPQLRRCEDMVL
jgi:hypothetical protein